MSEATDRVRIDVWLWRARFAKTRAQAAALVSEGAVRLVRGETSRQLDKPSATVMPGDALMLRQRGALRTIRVEALGVRRGPPAEARALYVEIEAEPNADIAGLA